MASRQILILIRSPAGTSVSGPTIQTFSENAARTQGFTPTQWTWASTSVIAVPDPTMGQPPAAGTVFAVVRGGPWDGFQFNVGGSGSIRGVPATVADPLVPTQGRSYVINAFRQNWLNGPNTGDVTPLRAALEGLTPYGAQGVRVNAASSSVLISWDHGVPAPFALVDSAPTSNWGALAGFAAIAALAFVASRGSAKKPVLAGGLRGAPMNREGLTFEEWRRAAGIAAGTRARVAWSDGVDPSEFRRSAMRRREGDPSAHLRGLNGTPAEHRAEMRKMLRLTRVPGMEHDSLIRANEEAKWVPEEAKKTRAYWAKVQADLLASPAYRTRFGGLDGTSAQHATKARSEIRKAKDYRERGDMKRANNAARVANAEAQWTGDESLIRASYREVWLSERP